MKHTFGQEIVGNWIVTLAGESTVTYSITVEDTAVRILSCSLSPCGEKKELEYILSTDDKYPYNDGWF